MDLSSLRALLKVNGHTPESSPEEIKEVLMKCGFQESEIPVALSILHGEPQPTTFVPEEARGVYVASTIELTGTSMNSDHSPSLFGRRITMGQFWLASILLIALASVVSLLVEITALPLFSYVSSVPLTVFPDLIRAPVSTFLLLGIGGLLLATPFVVFIIFAAGLQIRRFHDFGFSALVWFSSMSALFVVAYVLTQTVPRAPLIIVGVVAILLLILSLPSTNEDNPYGSTKEYPTLWGAIVGSMHHEGGLQLLYRRFILPIICIEALGITLAFLVHALAPHVPVPPKTSEIFAPMHTAPIRGLE